METYKVQRILFIVLLLGSIALHAAPYYLLDHTGYTFYDTDTWHVIDEIHQVAHGELIPNTGFPVITYLGSIVTTAADTPLDIFNKVGWMPVILAAIFAVCIYILVTKLFDEQVGFYAGIIVMYASGLLFQISMYGYIDHHLLELVTGFVMIVCVLLAITQQKLIYVIPAIISGYLLYYTSYLFMFYIAIAAGMVGFLLICYALKHRKWLWALLAFVPVAWWLYPQIIGSGLYTMMFTWSEPISEISAMNPVGLLIRLNILIPIIAYGIYRAIRTRTFEPLSIALFIAVIVLTTLTLKFIRLEFMLTAFLAVLAGYYLWKYFDRDHAYMLLSIFLVFSLVISTFSIGLLTSTAKYNSDWSAGITYLQDQPEGLVLAWWDVGYWLTAASNHTAYSNPSQENAGSTAQIFLSPPINATASLNNTKIKYVAVYVDDKKFYKGMSYYSKPVVDYNQSYLHALTETTEYSPVFQQGRLRVYQV